MDQRFRGLVDWLFESAETKSAHLMKKATLRGLFALGPTLIKMFIKINGSGWHQAWCGQVLHNPAHTAVSPLLLASVLSSMERSHGTDQQERFQPCGALDRAGWPSVVSEQAHLGAAPHLSPKCERSAWPNQFFPFPPAENHRRESYNHGISCIGGTQRDHKAQLKACASAAQHLHRPKNAALAGQEAMHEHPCPPEPAWPPEPCGTTWVPPSPAASITKARICGISLFLFPFFPP